MLRSRCAPMLLIGVLVGGSSILLGWDDSPCNATMDGSWRNHPALAAPDGQSHRGDKMVAADISDPRVLAELIRRFQRTKPLRITEHDGTTVVRGVDDFEKRQEYFLRLLDHYWFSKPRLVGMTWAEVDHVFGPLGPVAERAHISAGRDTLCLWFKDGACTGAYYSPGY